LGGIKEDPNHKLWVKAEKSTINQIKIRRVAPPKDPSK
jgi:hypothetical protein